MNELLKEYGFKDTMRERWHNNKQYVLKSDPREVNGEYPIQIEDDSLPKNIQYVANNTTYKVINSPDYV